MRQNCLLCYSARKQLIESLKKKTDENVLECFGKSSCSRFEDDIANCLTDNVPLNAKFTLNQTVHELQVQAKHKLKRRYSGTVKL